MIMLPGDPGCIWCAPSCQHEGIASKSQPARSCCRLVRTLILQSVLPLPDSMQCYVYVIVSHTSILRANFEPTRTCGQQQLFWLLESPIFLTSVCGAFFILLAWFCLPRHFHLSEHGALRCDLYQSLNRFGTVQVHNGTRLWFERKG